MARLLFFPSLARRGWFFFLAASLRWRQESRFHIFIPMSEAMEGSLFVSYKGDVALP